MDRHRVEQHAPDVVLALVPGAVTRPHRPRPLVAGKVVERPLVKLALAADAVHDLRRRRLTVSSRNAKNSNASHSKPSVGRPRSRNAESRTQLKR